MVKPLGSATTVTTVQHLRKVRHERLQHRLIPHNIRPVPNLLASYLWGASGTCHARRGVISGLQLAVTRLSVPRDGRTGLKQSMLQLHLL